MSDNKIINEVKQSLQMSLDDWLGNDYPEVGSEDYETWQAKQNAIDRIECVEDIAAYAARFEADEDGFLASWNL